jgi:hypothetical protein
MKQVTINVYTYAELLKLGNQNAINKATEWLQECATMDGWYEYVYDTWAAALAQIGFENAKIEFSGFWSQGDGASFTADIDVEKLAKFLASDIPPKDCIEGDPEDFRPWIVHKCGKPTDTRYAWLTDIGLYGRVVRTSHQYSHENTCRADIEYREPREHTALEAVIGEFEKDAETLRLNLCGAIYRDLEQEHEYLMSEEYLHELAEINEYMFRIDGRPE